MLAAIAIVKALARTGSRVFKEVPSYGQVRLKTPMDRRKALAAIKRLQRESPDSDQTDGVKLEASKQSWVLIRVSGTEDAVRVSAESKSLSDAQDLAESFMKRVKSLG
jgi:phosphomannomutase